MTDPLFSLISDSHKVMNDIAIPKDENATGKSIDLASQVESEGRHFQIKFNEQSKRYQLMDLGIGSGTFLKLAHRRRLRDN